jgi:hypothetical protein
MSLRAPRRLIHPYHGNPGRSSGHQHGMTDMALISFRQDATNNVHSILAHSIADFVVAGR